MPGPLDGIRVVEMCVAVTGPLAVGLLVDQGAEAVKVEEPGFGDQVRYVGVESGGISAVFQMCNRGKRSIAVDCTRPQGRDIVLDLAAGADVFVQNMRPGVVERLGLGYADVSARHPGIVYASISGFGPDGPHAHRRVYDSVIQAQSGLVANQTGVNDESPRFLRQAAADKITSYTAAQAITAALLARERGAGGQHLHLAMLDASVAFLFADAAAHEVALDNDQPHLAQSFSAHQRAVALADGHVVVAAVTDSEFHGMAKAFGVDSSDLRVATMRDRQRHKEQASKVFRAVHAAAAAMTVAEAEQALDRHEVPFGIVLGVEDVAAEAQAVHNQLFEEHDHPAMGRVRQPRPAARFSATPAELRQPSSPVHGQHTDEVLKELGLTGSIDRLRADGVIK